MSKAKTIEALIVKRIKETKDTVTLRLNLPNSFEWSPGQFITVQAMIDGESVRRAYSISSSPSRKDYLEITIRQTDEPTMSKYLNEIQEGETLNVRGPYGRFIWTEEVSEKAFFLAAGSGITPFRAFLQYIQDNNLDNEVVLLYTCAYGDNVIFMDEMKEFQESLPNLEYQLFLTRDQSDHQYMRGRIHGEILGKMIEGFENANYYMCGTPGFVSAMMDTLKELGISKEQLHREQWG